MPIDIVVDAMGSDKAPEPEVRGAVLAAVNYDVRVHLVGPEEILRPVAAAGAARAASARLHRSRQRVDQHGRQGRAGGPVQARLHHARRPEDGPRRRALRGFFTAGNTGAAMATAKMVLGMLAGVDRPALATILPTVHGSPFAAARRGRQRGLRPRQPGPVRRHGQHVCAERAARFTTRASACSPSGKRTRRATRSPAIRCRCCAR